jgi:tripartite ATP-independent transporter DctP family solute receptor
MKKMRLFGIVLAFVLQGCSSQTSLIIKASSSSAVNEPAVKGLEIFGREVSHRTAGAVQVEVYPNSALGNEREVVELTIIVAVELVCPSNAPLATFVPELMVFELPYLFRDREHLYQVLDGPIGQGFIEPLRRRGLRLLGYFDLGHRHLMTRDRVVEGIEHLDGLKIRTMENALHLRAFEAFGASPLPMAYGEVYTALEQGVIDGAEAARTNYYAKRFFEVAPYWAEIGWMYIISPLVMSERFYQSLSDRQRQAVVEAARVAIEWERQEYQRQEESAFAELRAAGVQMTAPATDSFVKAAEQVWRDSSDRVDLKLVDAILKARGKP